MRWLALGGLAPPMALAFFALAEPWARARVVFLWGISRSPGAALLVVVSLIAAMVTGMAVASGRRPVTAALAHLSSGVVLGVVSLLAYRMIRRAGVRAFGLVPLAAVKPGRGLLHFSVASLLVVGLGALELALVLAARRGVGPGSPAPRRAPRASRTSAQAGRHFRAG